MFSSGRPSISIAEKLDNIKETQVLYHYFNIVKIPTVINSPLREDKRASLGIYSTDGIKVKFLDWATGERGGIYDLLSQMWHLSIHDTIDKVCSDLKDSTCSSLSKSHKLRETKINHKSNTSIQVKIRDWKDYDIKYWESYGISLKWLKYAEVYPISHKIIVKDNHSYTFSADKYAYAYIERKEGTVSIKVYQPFNKKGFKWSNSHDRSVISLWTKVPKNGDRICICSSLKDALCLWENTGIPTLAVQGEGYTMSTTAVEILKKRYKSIYILFDNDAPGLADGKNLAKSTGFTNLVLPQFDGGKDVSDLYMKLQDREKFKSIILKLFN